MDIADRAADLQQRLNDSALAQRKRPSHLRGNPRCNLCGGPNDQPEYARCSDCVYDPAPPRRDIRQVTCGECREFVVHPEAPDGAGRCRLGERLVRTGQGLFPLIPTLKHSCKLWGSATEICDQ